MKNYLIIFLLVLIVYQAESQGIDKTRRPDQVLVAWAKHAKQGSNLQLWMSNQSTLGEQAWDGNVPANDCFNYGIGCSYPAGSCIEHLFGAGPFVGGIINGARYITQGYNGNSGVGFFIPSQIDTARNRFWHTSIDTITSANRKRFDDDGDGKIDEDELDGTDNDGDWNPSTDDLGADGLPDSLEVGCKGSFDPVTNPDPAFDNYAPSSRDYCHPTQTGSFPFKNDKALYTQNNGIPDHGEPNVDEDYGATSQSDYYCSYTDTTPYLSHRSMHVKVWQKSYAWEQGSAADAIVMFDYSIVNIGTSTINDVYTGMFADMDVGPIYVPGFSTHNYAAYDSATRTAYVQNPVDAGSTPLGMTLLGTSRALDSLKTIFQWHDFAPPCGGTGDSDLYSCISGEAFPDGYIKPNQSQDDLNDTRVLVSNGPFGPMQPGDTVKMYYAFVSGSNVIDMLQNAQRAHRIFDSKYFIMPVAQIEDSGGTHPVLIHWKPVKDSPYGNVTSYQVQWGSLSGVFDDSATTTDTMMSLTRSQFPNPFAIAVRAIDNEGNKGAFSDNLTNLPHTPPGIHATAWETSIALTWQPTTDRDLAGYNIYRKSSNDTAYTKLNTTPISQLLYSDSAVWGNRTYTYKVSSVDDEGNESQYGDTVSSHLLRPAAPAEVAVGAGPTYIRLGWRPNTEGDLNGYNIYRSSDADTAYIKLTPAPLKATVFTDTSVLSNVIYTYEIEAIDTTEAVSPFNNLGSFQTSHPTQNILFAIPVSDSIESLDMFYYMIFQGYSNIVMTVVTSPIPLLGNNTYINTLGNFSTIIWVQDNIPSNYTYPSYPICLKAQVLAGRNVIIIGKQLLVHPPNFWYRFLNDYFGVDLLTKIDTNYTFAGAAGYQGYPSLHVDTVKLSSTGGRLNNIERFPNVPDYRVIYRYVSNPYDPNSDGDPVAIRALDTSYHAYYVSFPLYDLDTASAKLLMAKLLQELGEQPLAVKDEKSPVPQQFELSQNYPNPFNPSTNIRFSVAGTRMISVKIYDVLGREVTTVVNEQMQPGVYTKSWNANNVAGGMYFCRMIATDEHSKQVFSQTTKLMLVK